MIIINGKQMTAKELAKEIPTEEELIAELDTDLYQEVLAVKAETIIPENRCMELLNQICLATG